MDLVACKQHKFKIGGLRTSLVAFKLHSEAWWQSRLVVYGQVQWHSSLVVYGQVRWHSSCTVKFGGVTVNLVVAVSDLCMANVANGSTRGL